MFFEPSATTVTTVRGRSVSYDVESDCYFYINSSGTPVVVYDDPTVALSVALELNDLRAEELLREHTQLLEKRNWIKKALSSYKDPNQGTLKGEIVGRH